MTGAEAVIRRIFCTDNIPAEILGASFVGCRKISSRMLLSISHPGLDKCLLKITFDSAAIPGRKSPTLIKRYAEEAVELLKNSTIAADSFQFTVENRSTEFTIYITAFVQELYRLESEFMLDSADASDYR